jgi:hypothetical protein
MIRSSTCSLVTVPTELSRLPFFLQVLRISTIATCEETQLPVLRNGI